MLRYKEVVELPTDEGVAAWLNRTVDPRERREIVPARAAVQPHAKDSRAQDHAA